MEAPGEFELIRRFFTRRHGHQAGSRLMVGDDCALIEPVANQQLAVTTDTLVEGIHFFPGTDAESLGFKCLAVNLSDLAAMGAKPRWITLALTLPDVDEHWLAAFATGFLQLADRYAVDLVGGDTTRGPRAITVTAMGSVAACQELRRSGASPGDLILVTGYIGSAGLGLKMLQEACQVKDEACLERLHRPEPRVAAGSLLRGMATACTDISDGLLADLGHILDSSGCGAILDIECIPLLEPVKTYVDATADWRFPLTCGDDYELCFTLPPEKLQACMELLGTNDCKATVIGRVDSGSRLRISGLAEALLPVNGEGYQHF